MVITDGDLLCTPVASHSGEGTISALRPVLRICRRLLVHAYNEATLAVIKTAMSHKARRSEKQMSLANDKQRAIRSAGHAQACETRLDASHGVKHAFAFREAPHCEVVQGTVEIQSMTPTGVSCHSCNAWEVA